MLAPHTSAALVALLMAGGLLAVSATEAPAPPVANHGAALIQQQDAAARAAELDALKAYEQADYNAVRGDAELPPEPHHEH